MSLIHVRIILVEPAGALNVGSVARVMKNMGLQHLVLVNPQCDPGSAEARQMAVKAIDVLEAADVVMTLPEALSGCQRAIATTGADRRTALNVTLEHPREALPWLLEGLNSPMPIASALIFGREDRGLSKEELNYAQRFVQIPTDADYLSLNLAQAVAICCYELADCIKAANLDQPEPSQPGSNLLGDLATFEQLEGYYQQLESLLLKIGYLHLHTAASRMEKMRRLYSRASLSAAEVAMLRGVVSQMEWALKTKNHILPSPMPNSQPPTPI